MLRLRFSISPSGPSWQRRCFEAEAVVAGLPDVAMMREAIEHGRRHLGVAEHADQFAEAQIGGDRD